MFFGYCNVILFGLNELNVQWQVLPSLVTMTLAMLPNIEGKIRYISYNQVQGLSWTWGTG